MSEYEFKYKIRLDDLDYMGIVGNANWFIILQRARIDLCELIVYSFKQMTADQMVAHADIKYLRPAIYDDLITVKIIPCVAHEKGFTLKYVVKNQNNKNCILAEFKIIFVNNESRPVTIPEKVYNNL